jgi:hypothetical protein
VLLGQIVVQVSQRAHRPACAAQACMCAYAHKEAEQATVTVAG